MMEPWQVKNEGRASRLSHIMNTAELSDVIFTVYGPTEGKREIKSHSLVLAMASPVFEKMLYGPMANKRTDDNLIKIDIMDIEFEVFKSLISYIYIEKLEPTNSLEMLKLYIAADKYYMKDLMIECLDYITSHITTDEVIPILEYSISTDNNRLRECLKKIIEADSKKILDSDKLSTVCAATLKAFLCDYQIRSCGISELDILKICLEWCGVQMTKINTAKKKRHLVLNDLLVKSGIGEAVDFKSVSVLDFMLTLRKVGIFEGDECFQILSNFSVGTWNEETSGAAKATLDMKTRKFEIRVNSLRSSLLADCTCNVEITPIENFSLVAFSLGVVGKVTMRQKEINGTWTVIKYHSQDDYNSGSVGMCTLTDMVKLRKDVTCEFEFRFTEGMKKYKHFKSGYVDTTLFEFEKSELKWESFAEVKCSGKFPGNLGLVIGECKL